VHYGVQSLHRVLQSCWYLAAAQFCAPFQFACRTAYLAVQCRLATISSSSQLYAGLAYVVIAGHFTLLQSPFDCISLPQCRALHMRGFGCHSSPNCTHIFPSLLMTFQRSHCSHSAVHGQFMAEFSCCFVSSPGSAFPVLPRRSGVLMLLVHFLCSSLAGVPLVRRVMFGLLVLLVSWSRLLRLVTSKQLVLHFTTGGTPCLCESNPGSSDHACYTT
jgi:hypothetical protein